MASPRRRGSRAARGRERFADQFVADDRPGCHPVRRRHRNNRIAWGVIPTLLGGRVISTWLGRNDMRFGNLAAAVAAVAMLSIPTALAQSQRPAAPPSALPFDRRDCPPGVGTAAPPAPRANETTGS